MQVCVNATPRARHWVIPLACLPKSHSRIREIQSHIKHTHTQKKKKKKKKKINARKSVRHEWKERNEKKRTEKLGLIS
jgi:hypothetical protein